MASSRGGETTARKSRLDQVIETVAPGWGASRARARARIAAAGNLRRYQAAVTTRLGEWLQNVLSADAELPPMDRQSMLAGIRDLLQNDPHAAGIVQHRVDNVVGEGMIVKPAVLPDPKNGLTEAIANAFNESMEVAWSDWRAQCDLAGRLDFSGVLRLLCREKTSSGDGLVAKRARLGAAWATAVEVIDADRLKSPIGYKPPAGHEVRDGIELGPNGEPVAYHIAVSHPGDTFSLKAAGGTVSIPAAAMLHVYDQLRPGQTRGVPWLAAVVPTMRRRGKYLELEMIAATVQNLFSAFIKTPGGEEPPSDSTDTRGNLIADMEPGGVHYLGMDQDVSFGTPSHPTTNFEPFMRAVGQHEARGLGVSYESMTSDRTASTWSSDRSGLLDERSQHRIEQRRIARAAKVMYGWIVEEAVMRGRAAAPFEVFARNRAAFLRCVVRGRGWQWVDPDNEGKAEDLALRGGRTTYEDVYGARGEDYLEKFDQEAKEKKERADRGLPLLQPEPANGQPGEADQQPGGNNGESEAGDNGDGKGRSADDVRQALCSR